MSYNDLYGTTSMVGSIQSPSSTIINLTVGTISAYDNTNITVNNNLVLPSPNHFIGNLAGSLTGNGIGNWTGNVTGNLLGNVTGNVEGNITGTATNFSGVLDGDIIGTQFATQIATGVIVDADINSAANIQDTKLATISTSGKVANSATTATASNTNQTIVLRDATGTNLPQTIISGSLIFNGASRNISMNGGNSNGYIFTNQAALGDGIYMGYNFYYPTGSTTPTFPFNSAGTSLLCIKFGQITMATGLPNTVPTNYFSVTSNGRFTSLNGGYVVSDVTGNVTGNCSGSSATFTGSLSGDITGTMSATQIAAGAIVNADINASAGISDTKLATISTTGKVANSATTATAANTDATIVLRDNTNGVNLPSVNMNGNLTFSGGSNYRNINMSGGNSTGYIYTNWPALGDGIHLGYNCYYPSGSTTPFIPNSGGRTTRFSMSYGMIQLGCGAINTEPTIYFSLASNGNWVSSNGAVVVSNVTGNCSGSSATFTGSLAGDITGTMSATQIATRVIVNADINASAAIADTKLATISTTGKVANSATTATASNTAGAIVSRDGSGHFAASSVFLSGGSYALQIFSGSNSALASESIGRTIPEENIGIAGVNGDFFSNCAPGDSAVQLLDDTKILHLGTGSSSSTVQITNTTLSAAHIDTPTITNGVSNVNFTTGIDMNGTQVNDCSAVITNQLIIQGGGLTIGGSSDINIINPGNWLFNGQNITGVSSINAIHTNLSPVAATYSCPPPSCNTFMSCGIASSIGVTTNTFTILSIAGSGEQWGAKIRGTITLDGFFQSEPWAIFDFSALYNTRFNTNNPGVILSSAQVIGTPLINAVTTSPVLSLSFTVQWSGNNLQFTYTANQSISTSWITKYDVITSQNIRHIFSPGSFAGTNVNITTYSGY